MFVVPRDPASDCKEVQNEFKEIFANRFPKIKDWRSRVV